MDMKIMRSNIQPTSALPVTRNMPYHSASVPSRNQPRNMTGIYLGLEGNIKPPSNRSFIPFMKPRAGMSPKVRTTAEDRRYKKVELLRIKEETRGFRGQTVKKHRQQEDHIKENIKPKSGTGRQWGPAKSANPTKFEDRIRQNPRNFTHVINNGISRSENLQGFMSYDDHYSNYYTYDLGNMLLPNALIEEVERVSKEREDLLGLEECYKKVCKGNTESLQSLLPLRKSSARADNYSTGFTVRSYRNPNKAELLADFDVQPILTHHPRPKTVPATQLQRQQPLVPAPYFFKYYNKPQTAGQRPGKSPSLQFEEQMNSGESGDKIFGASGSGAISRSVRHGRTSAWSEDDLNNRIVRRGTPRTDSPLKDNTESRHIHIPQRNDSIPTISEPLEIRAEGYQNNTEDKTPLTDRTTNENPPNTIRSSDQSTRNGTSTEASSPQKSPVKSERKDKSYIQLDASGRKDMMDGQQREPGDNTIRLDLETEDGKKQEIILDDRGGR